MKSIDAIKKMFIDTERHALRLQGLKSFFYLARISEPPPISDVVFLVR